MAGLINAFVDRIGGALQTAAGGSWGAFGYDFGRALTLLNLWHPDVANWDTVIELLGSHVVMTTEKAGALGILAAMPEMIPQEVSAELLVFFESGDLEAGEVDPLFNQGSDLRGAAAELGASLRALDEEVSATYLLDLLSGGVTQRQWAAQVARRLNRPEDAGFLLALIHDEEPQVRAVAGMGLASLAILGVKTPAVLGGLRRCLADPGTTVPQLVAGVLREGGTDADIQGLLGSLVNHVSARVRQVVER